VEESATKSDSKSVANGSHASTERLPNTRGRIVRVENAAGPENGEQSLHTTCTHELVYPPEIDIYASERRLVDQAAEGIGPSGKKYDKPAKEYPFVLDAFQRESLSCIEKGESVLVSAHTSAGKTVVAEYAIATSLRDKQRVIYTSPIKALSNQKYRELHEEFEDVGLMTGDTTINPNASVLVMTTEILRSMLYKGSEVMREVAWVIFDEIHYMRDRERGVVWEESIIMVPDKVRFVFLSATIPNAREFAQWVSAVHQQPCHVVYTDYRPVPLQHYIFPAGGDGLHLVVDEKGTFREDNFQKALASLGENRQAPPRRGANGKEGKKGSGGGAASDVYKIVKMIMERHYEPVIIFSFSKRECEGLALQMSKLDFNTEDEKKLVESVFNNAIDSLSEDDRHIPQVEHILPLLKRGVGIHHSGLLPILKEVIEILFQEGLLKALFATETFSIGLNMPAKTVVFTSVRKFDGENFRWISGGEYIQMSGRAGRRGKDDRGIVILMVDEKMEPPIAKEMLQGQADPLTSSFHLTYNMLLNLLRVEDADPDYLIKRSFCQFQTDKNLPDMEIQVRQMEAEAKSLQVFDEPVVAEFYNLCKQLEELREQAREIIHRAAYAVPFLQPGRLVKVRDASTDWGWGVIINFQRRGGSDQKETSSGPYVVDVLLRCKKGPGKPMPCPDDEPAEYQIIPVLLPLLDGLSQLRVFVPKDLRPVEPRNNLGKSIAEVQRRFPDGVPLLHPIDDMNVDDPGIKKIYKKLDAIQQRLREEKAFTAPDLADRLKVYEKKAAIEEQCRALRRQCKSAKDLIMKDELKNRKRVLRRLGYTNSENVIEMKGRVACEISTADELLATELIFNGVFNSLEPEHIVALMSCLIYQEKSKETVKLKEELAGPLRILQEASRRIATVCQDCKLPVDVEEYVQSFKPDLMDVVFAWCKGAKFSDICKMTDIFEGSIIRAMRRLEELLRQLSAAAKSIGNEELEKRFDTGSEKLKRDIVFAASLYL